MASDEALAERVADVRRSRLPHRREPDRRPDGDDVLAEWIDQARAFVATLPPK